MLMARISLLVRSVVIICSATQLADIGATGYAEEMVQCGCNQCCGSGPFWSDPDPDVWDRIRILALINDSVSTFIVCVKAIYT
jgi:hypothetical protein